MSAKATDICFVCGCYRYNHASGGHCFVSGCGCIKFHEEPQPETLVKLTEAGREWMANRDPYHVGANVEETELLHDRIPEARPVRARGLGPLPHFDLAVRDLFVALACVGVLAVIRPLTRFELVEVDK